MYIRIRFATSLFSIVEIKHSLMSLLNPITSRQKLLKLVLFHSHLSLTTFGKQSLVCRYSPDFSHVYMESVFWAIVTDLMPARQHGRRLSGAYRWNRRSWDINWPTIGVVAPYWCFRPRAALARHQSRVPVRNLTLHRGRMWQRFSQEHTAPRLAHWANSADRTSGECCWDNCPGQACWANTVDRISGACGCDNCTGTIAPGQVRKWQALYQIRQS